MSHFEILTPVKCVACGKIAPAAKFMTRLDEKGLTHEMLLQLKTKYLGQYICSAYGQCWDKVKIKKAP